MSRRLAVGVILLQATLSVACVGEGPPAYRTAAAAPVLTRTLALPFPPPLPPVASTSEIPPPPRTQGRTIQAGSTLQIDVAGVPALSLAKVKVGADGRVFLPFIGRVHAAGLQPLELGALLERRLVDQGYLRGAQVDVNLLEQPGRVYVLGSVTRPGAYPLPVGSTLRITQLVAMAGGLYTLRPAQADPSALRLIREVDGQRRTFRISFLEITVGGRLEADVPVQADDVVYVPPQKELFVFGSVKEPGGFPLLEGNRLGVDEVLALAGGFQETASQNGLLLVRRQGSGVFTYRIPDDPVKRAEVELASGDTLIVPARALRRVFVLGSVKAQGGIPLEPDLTVTGAVALAGGLNRIAAGNSVRLIRRGPDGRKHVYDVPVSRILNDGDIDLDPVLEPGDIIFVPEGFL
ncbi:MAG: polysaccharide biosynthesis/export family protein [Planctomycetota bacterium]